MGHVARPPGLVVVSILKRRSRALLKSNAVIAKHPLQANPDTSSVLVIYDGECDFCKASLGWLQLKNPVKALPFQNAPLHELGLSYEECTKQVVVISHDIKYLGADAIALLLKIRGNKVLSATLSAAGPLGRFGYRWVAVHRNSLVIRLWTRVLQRKLSNAS